MPDSPARPLQSRIRVCVADRNQHWDADLIVFLGRLDLEIDVEAWKRDGAVQKIKSRPKIKKKSSPFGQDAVIDVPTVCVLNFVGESADASCQWLESWLASAQNDLGLLKLLVIIPFDPAYLKICDLLRPLLISGHADFVRWNDLWASVSEAGYDGIWDDVVARLYVLVERLQQDRQASQDGQDTQSRRESKEEKQELAVVGSVSTSIEEVEEWIIPGLEPPVKPPLTPPLKQPVAVSIPNKAAKSQAVLHELHDPGSGRLNTKRVAMYFGVPVSRLAVLLGTSPQAIHKTPDAASVQSGLAAYHAVAVALRDLLGTPEVARAWLHAPNGGLDGDTPMRLIEKGQVEGVIRLLDDVSSQDID